MTKKIPKKIPKKTQLLHDIVNAWETLPEGNRPIWEVVDWLQKDMWPVIQNIRKELKLPLTKETKRE